MNVNSNSKFKYPELTTEVTVRKKTTSEKKSDQEKTKTPRSLTPTPTNLLRKFSVKGKREALKEKALKEREEMEKLMREWKNEPPMPEKSPVSSDLPSDDTSVTELASLSSPDIVPVPVTAAGNPSSDDIVSPSSRVADEATSSTKD